MPKLLFEITATRVINLTAIIEATDLEDAEKTADVMLTEDFDESGTAFTIDYISQLEPTPTEGF
jgi:hypothetical protein